MTISTFKGTFAALLGAGLLAACGGTDEAESVDAGSADSTEMSMGEAMLQGSETSTLPDWTPEDIYLPADFTVTGSQAIGTRTYIVMGTSAMPLDELLSTYRNELEAAGYDLTPLERMPPDEPAIYFDGNGLETAQVRVNDTGDLRELQIDFSKEM